MRNKQMMKNKQTVNNRMTSYQMTNNQMTNNQVTNNQMETSNQMENNQMGDKQVKMRNYRRNIEFYPSFFHYHEKYEPGGLHPISARQLSRTRCLSRTVDET
jgi:hypothetical protein